MTPGPTPTPRAQPDLDLVIARLLTVGTYVSIAILAVGLATMLVAGLSPYSAAPPLDLANLPADLLALRPAAFLWLGLLAVIATPTARIVAALVGYVRTQEREMTYISVAILGVISLSVILARLAEA
jgi:uncharacterized membrane protein